ncbi:MAG: primosomal protein N', partial [Candidatus Omnitrophica bacterium]|nr:primosomal protein N' [Candidatus Omnitrophota bacterium]
MKNQYVEVITSLPIDHTFQYKVTGKEQNAPAVGKRVHIPFRESTRIGYIVKIEDEPQVESPKPLIDIIDEEPIFSQDMIDLAKWIKDNYFCSWGEALEAMIPGPLKHGKISMVTRVKEIGRKVEPTEPHVPNDEQRVVIDNINQCVDNGKHEVFLLHGITGSGKTEIYLQVMEKIIAKGKTGIILVPEISLTPQTVERFISRFGEHVAIFHSKMLESTKFNEWQRIKAGRARVVVGPRSAVFSPFSNLGVIVIDEEHEPSYKQEDVPRYHAREVAIQRAKIAKIPVILGSATPSLESYHKAISGEYRLAELTQRVEEKKLPRIKLVDMRMEFETRTGKEIISHIMQEALRNDVSKKQQVLIFLNRRGFSTFVMCKKCGGVIKCSKCSSPMVFHQERNELLCHYCGKKLQPLATCPACGDINLEYKGMGTQRVESEIKKILPGVRMARMDSDTMTKRLSHDTVLQEFKEHKLDVIVGTQMIAKGLDFPKVTLVGVVSADANLNLPDFRSGERTFNLITQVAGRAGRGDLGGEVIVQSYTPEHYAVSLAAKHDYHGFYDREIIARKELNFPPFVSLVKITLKARKEDSVTKSAEDLARLLGEKIKDISILGPAPSPMPKLRGYFRWNILIKSHDREKIVKDLR